MRWALLASFLVLSACQSAPQRTNASAPLAPGIYATRDFERTISHKEFYGALGAYTYVLVGETHDSPEDHALQVEIYRALTANDRRVALGMEMFQKPFQAHLDRYVSNEIDEEAMLIATEYDSRWGFEPRFYSPLWQHAKVSNLAIVALNAHRELTKRVSAVGIQGLSTAERAELPDIDLSSEAYRTWLRDIFAGHGMKLEPEKFERFFEAQVLWDEQMAQTAVEFMTANPQYSQMVIAVGRGHVERGWGIPDRIHRREPNASLAVVVRVPEGTTFDQAVSLADYVIVE